MNKYGHEVIGSNYNFIIRINVFGDVMNEEYS